MQRNMLTTKDREYWNLKPIKRNWCIHNQGMMTPYGSLYCKLRQITVDKEYQCAKCTDKSQQYELFTQS